MAEVSAVHSDPNFAIVCSFIDRHGSLLNLPDVSFDALQRYLEEARFGNVEIVFCFAYSWREFRLRKCQQRIGQQFTDFFAAVQIIVILLIVQGSGMSFLYVYVCRYTCLNVQLWA